MDEQGYNPPGQSTENVGNPQRDESFDNPDPNVTPTVNPVDNPDVDAQGDDSDDRSILDRLTEASGNLTPSEIPAPDKLPALFGAFLHFVENGDFPEPLHKRFPDHYNDPNE